MMSSLSELPAVSSSRLAADLLFRPWWRAALLALALIWCAGLNLVYISAPELFEILGPISVIPIWVFVIDVLLRRARILKAARAKE